MKFLNDSKITVRLSDSEDSEASLMTCSNDASLSGSSDSADDLFWCLDTYLTTVNKYLETDYKAPKLYFCRLSLPESKKISSEKNKLWGLMKQAQQYKYYRHKLLGHVSTTCINYMFCYFEQFKSGNIHVHLIVDIGDEHIINLKSELSELFCVNKKEEMKQFFHSQPVEDLEAVRSYLFDKKEHSYENLNQDVFKPIVLTRHSAPPTQQSIPLVKK